MRLLIPLFSPPTGTWGGLTRVIAVAEAAMKSDHAVAFCASGYIAEALRRRGYQVVSLPETTMFGLPKPLSHRLEGRSGSVTPPVPVGKAIGSIWFVLLITGFGSAGTLRRAVEVELQAARDFRADMLFTDLNPATFLVSTLTGLPVASNYASIVTTGRGGFAWRIMRRAVCSVLKSYGKPARDPEEICFSESVLKIIPSIPELDGTDPGRPDVCYVGHLLGDIQADADFQPQPGKRYVFAYFGVGSVSLERIKVVLPQVFPEDGPLACLVGSHAVKDPFRIGGVEFRHYFPAEAILPHCEWTFSHGGQNTIIQSLRRGVPLVIFPGPIFERRFNASKVAQAGAGVMAELDHFNAEWLRTLPPRQAQCAEQARVLGERIRSFGGAPAAVDAMSAWLERKTT